MTYQILMLFHRWEKDAHGTENQVVVHSQVLRFKHRDDAEAAYVRVHQEIDCSVYRLYL